MGFRQSLLCISMREESHDHRNRLPTSPQFSMVSIGTQRKGPRMSGTPYL